MFLLKYQVCISCVCSITASAFQWLVVCTIYFSTKTMSRALPTLRFRIQKCMKQWTTSVLYSNASHTVCFELTVLWIQSSNKSFSFWISISIKKKHNYQTVQFLSTSGSKIFYTFFLHVMFKSCNAHVKYQIPNISFVKLIFFFKVCKQHGDKTT